MASTTAGATGASGQAAHNATRASAAATASAGSKRRVVEEGAAGTRAAVGAAAGGNSRRGACRRRVGSSCGFATVRTFAAGLWRRAVRWGRSGGRWPGRSREDALPGPWLSDTCCRLRHRTGADSGTPGPSPVCGASSQRRPSEPAMTGKKSDAFTRGRQRTLTTALPGVVSGHGIGAALEAPSVHTTDMRCQAALSRRLGHRRGTQGLLSLRRS